ncbi:MAG: hypothetical protein K0S78_4191, partial [Thermomicrobiales bacterium]|nr:hypothetical protein [Thermomicrobiales bacterium]
MGPQSLRVAAYAVTSYATPSLMAMTRSPKANAIARGQQLEVLLAGELDLHRLHGIGIEGRLGPDAVLEEERPVTDCPQLNAFLGVLGWRGTL